MKKQPTSTETPKSKSKKRRSQALFDVLQSIAKSQEQERLQYSRQVDYDDIFDKFSSGLSSAGIVLLDPPYLPGKMYELYEQSGILKVCVECYVDNIDGFGYDVTSNVSDDDNVQAEENPKVKLLKEFFDGPNDKETFKKIREALRRDIEATGNGYLEIIRDKIGVPVLAFWLDAKRTRITAIREPVMKTVQVMRGGKIIDIQAEKRYRSYCLLSSDGHGTGPRARYFKEYGDTRVMDAETGQFADEGATVKIPASEVIHFKHGNDTYGIPRWIGTLLSVMGAWKANMVNYDLFDNQGIPPLIISIMGGSLTEDSYDDVVNFFRRAKGHRNFHKLLILEAEGDAVGIDGRETAPRMQVQGLAEYRKEDAMFLNYLATCRDEVQKLGFRLPGMFLGKSDDANYATAFIVRKIAEEQIFIPERSRFDEIINKTIVKDLVGADTLLSFKSLGPTLQSVENLPAIINILVASGAFTTNGLISFINEHFGLRIALYDGEGTEWADLPIPKNATSVAPDEQEDSSFEDDADDEKEIIKKNQKIYAALKEIEETVAKFGSAA